MGRQLGRRQGLSGALVRAAGRASWARRTCGTRSPREPSRRSSSSSTRSADARDARARRRLRSGPPRHALAGGGSRSSASTSASGSSTWPTRTRRPGATFERVDARALPFDAEFDVAISLCQGAFGSGRRRGRRRARAAWPARSSRAVGSRSARSRRTSRCGSSRTRTRSTPPPASTTRRTDGEGRRRQRAGRRPLDVVLHPA